MSSHEDDEEDSRERALADIELLQAAYPDETSDGFVVDEVLAGSSSQLPLQTLDNRRFPFSLSLRLSPSAIVTLEWNKGYPMTTNIQIQSYRCRSEEKACMEEVLRVIRNTAQQCLVDEIEGGLACVAAALETWREHSASPIGTGNNVEMGTTGADGSIPSATTRQRREPLFTWMTGEPLLDRKSSFQAHVCPIQRESDVAVALHELLDGNSKLQRATHNMFAYRVWERQGPASRDTQPTKPATSAASSRRVVDAVLKSDNDDDGEHGAGSRLAHLLEKRKEDGVLVVVSRWYGGILLGPKRFAHISNVARDLLTIYHEQKGIATPTTKTTR